jgi:hypothetical protein
MGAIESNTKKLTEVEDAPSGYRIVGIAAASATTFHPSSSVRSCILEGSIDGTTRRMADHEDTFPVIARLRRRSRRRRRPPPSFVRKFPQPDVLVDVPRTQGPGESEVDEGDPGPPRHVRHLPVDVDLVAVPQVVVHHRPHPPRYVVIGRLDIPVYD